MSEITNYIRHPELIDREKIYILRKHLAKNPYASATRLLLLQALFIMRDNDFNTEMQTAALLLPDREILSEIIEKGQHPNRDRINNTIKNNRDKNSTSRSENIISNFLDQCSPTNEQEVSSTIKADASNDYTAYLLQLDDIEQKDNTKETERRQHLVDSFIHRPGPIRLNEKTEDYSENDSQHEPPQIEEDFFTETLASIYIKQERYDKALEIIRKLYLAYPKKNTYFADQIRFLEKLMITNK